MTKQAIENINFVLLIIGTILGMHHAYDLIIAALGAR